MPRRPPKKMWGGRASGTATCAICGRPIVSGLEFELDFGDVPPVFMHEPCFFTWEEERRRDAS
ncbi:MAG TPA: hypothetical protein VNN07_17530 [Candidatus Tectomicrobia bacterium]|nr:hypothetical protein [Candidatus Tectomicrobia bacterium]